MKTYPFSEIAPLVTLLGQRTNVTEAGLVTEWACSGFEMALSTEGTDLSVSYDSSYATYFKVLVDGVEAASRLVASGKGERVVAQDLPAGEHIVRVIKDGQPDKNGGSCTLTALSFDGHALPHTVPEKDLYLEFLGDSIWTGVGALGNRPSSPDYSREISATVATPYRTATALDADYNITARGSIGVVKDAGGLVASQLFLRLNGYRDETAYEAKRVPDAVIICLGANDPKSLSEQFVEDGKALIRLIRDTYGEETRIVWTYGMFSRSHLVREIGQIMEESGGEAAGLYALEMIYGQNGSGSGENNRHPSSSDHEKNAARLIPFLQQILGL